MVDTEGKWGGITPCHSINRLHLPISTKRSWRRIYCGSEM